MDFRPRNGDPVPIGLVVQDALALELEIQVIGTEWSFGFGDGTRQSEVPNRWGG